jgi:hypothetical protein
MFFRWIRLFLGNVGKFGNGTGKFWSGPEFFLLRTGIFRNKDTSIFRKKIEKTCEVLNLFLVFYSGFFSGRSFSDVVSTPVLNMLRSAGLGAIFLSAISQQPTTLVGFAFVDDTDLIASGPLMSLQDVSTRIQQSLKPGKGASERQGEQ